MKKISAFFLCLFLSSFCFSQDDYHPMIRDGFIWEIYNYTSTSVCETTGGSRYYFGSDTVYSDTTYKKVMRMPIVSLGPYNCPPYYRDTTASTRANFLMREDVENKRVYIKWDSFEETLLYDFGLEVGDTLFHNPNGDDGFYGLSQVVTFIDSVYLDNGEFRRNLHYDLWQNTIESIGPHNGIQHGGTFYLSGGGTLQGCANEDGVSLWSAMSSCSGILLSTTEAEDKKYFSLYPNPATKEIWLELEDFKNSYNYQVIDFLGKKWDEGQMDQLRKTVDVSRLPAGVYLIQLTNEKGKFASKKFVKISE